MNYFTRDALVGAGVVLTALSALAQPTITTQPNGQSASIGDKLQFAVTATGSATLTYQWRSNDVAIANATARLLTLTNTHTSYTAGYSAVITDDTGSVTSRVAHLVVDPTTFTKITEGAVVTNRLASWGGGWADFDNDGRVDLAVALANGLLIHRNLGDGTFTKTQERLGTGTTSLSWGDMDNDGYLDILTSGMGGAPGITNTLFRNNGDGTFSRITAGQLCTEHNGMYASSWADYDNDGYLDAFLAGLVAGRRLHHNNGDGTFTRITNSALVQPPNGEWQGVAWGDYNNDGRMDVFVSCGINSGSNLLLRNDGSGRFTRITDAAPVRAGSAYWDTASWTDYDNDGDFDLFVNKWGPGEMYRNNGDGTFTRVTAGIPQENACATAWGDYNNDGYLDVFFAKQGGGSGGPGYNAFYRNNGDGTFTKIQSLSPVKDYSTSITPGWGDYDNDGFLDLFVANDGGGNNFLYHNNGNSNHWLKLRLIGLASNRAAIGAKVRVQATIRGQATWQLRQVNAGSGFGGNDLNPHFGLGDATNINVARIEWPSGAMQELVDVPPNQFLTIWEPPAVHASVLQDGSCQLTIAAEPNRPWRIQASTDMSAWQTLDTVTNTQVTFQFKDAAAHAMDCRFYRVAGN